MRRFVFRGLTLTLCLALTWWAWLGAPPAAAKRPGDAGAWLSALPDELPISAVAIPGTHDTMSYAGGALWWLTRPFARTQAVDLEAQLRAGVRFLDLRLTPEGGFAHGWVPLSGDFGGTMRIIETFLAGSPGEVILARIRDESGADPQRLREAIAVALAPYADTVWIPPIQSESEALPTLGELRGKMLLLDDTGGTLAEVLERVTPYGPGSQWIQDDFDAPALEAKAEQIRATIRLGAAATAEAEARGIAPERLILNFASATDQPGRTPASYAKLMNAVVREQFALLEAAGAPEGSAVAETRPVPAGVVVLDDPDGATLRAIIAANDEGVPRN